MLMTIEETAHQVRSTVWWIQGSAREAPPKSISLISMQFLAKFLSNNRFLVQTQRNPGSTTGNRIRH